jgi:hypothetical protein
LERASVEPPTNTSPTSSTELEQLEKEQALGEAKYLGCPRIEAQSTLPKTTSKATSKEGRKTG